jgi:hypothetical protein
MYNQLQISMGFISYVESFKIYSDLLSKYKTELHEKFNFSIPHPAYLKSQFFTNSFNSVFQKEIDIFGSVELVIKALVILNYHIGNIDYLTDLYEIKQLNDMSFTFTMEELLIVSSFNKVINE